MGKPHRKESEESLMGKRGPRPVPTAIKERRGTKKQLTKYEREPQAPKTSQPEAPAGVSGVAKKAWPGLVGLLEGMGVLTTADLRIVERYLETWAIWRRNLDFIAEKGDVYPIKQWNPHAGVPGDDGKTKSGALEVIGFREFPHVRIVARMANLLISMERELGLTPSARTRIELDSQSPRGVGRPPGTRKDSQIDVHDVRSGPRLKIVKGA